MPKSEALRGLRDAAPFLIVIAPFGMLFGVVATEAGLPIAQTMAMTMLVIAGASQFTALQLMTDGAGVFLALAGALAVNLRMAMYSAALAPHLGPAPFWQRALCGYFNFDQSYALSVARYEAQPALPLPSKVAYFLGVALPIATLWTGMTLFGALVGGRIPEAFALDFALPITFISLIAPMLKTLAHVAAALTSVVLALALAWLPSGFGLLIAAACAMVAGAVVETLMVRPA
ncbi:AzlC family ABC transporter permease [Histidinibacterium aquaticum]|uniref:Branched-chain amino acid ABC transporter permease n=1 Tax=Histidinibacterium aquaticum TaxID=2613962 RepID=A0A5J5GR61_9RHOB|nr:AzlC family ABC transporter permease [Histidinibacterium aquaticum]KAA9010557.1 branched-chain amino acid ABC transporter permease [Histidinibacterium aquaticum]